MRSIFKSITAFLLALCLTAACGATIGCIKESRPEYDEGADYAETLFDTERVHEIDVQIKDEDWADLIANPLKKTKYETSVTIDGEKLDSVSFSTKGNTSLSFVASDPESVRYSFKLNFGKFEEGQTYRGLNKLNLNNLYADATYLKDYISYEIFRRAGVEAPLVSFVLLSVNGKAHGLYLAIEDVSESYLERTANGEGELYKPESSRLSMDKNDGRGEMPQPPQGGGQMPQGSGQPQFPGQPPNASDTPQGPGFSGGSDRPGGAGQTGPDMPDPDGQSGGADLKYVDDEPSSYPDVFDNDVTDASDESKLRVIEALKGIAAGEDIEKYADTEALARYFAAHNFVLNYDSYTGNMLHNYYLYENGGRLSMLPWDYNLAFGAFMGGGREDGGATALVNCGVDSPLSGASNESRPMWALIAENDECLSAYHAAYDKLLKEYFESGEFEKQFDKLVGMIRPFVKKDPSAFYTAEEFEAGVDMLKSFCLKRAESIRLQIDGKLAAVTGEQNEADRVDASDIDISVMGTHGGPGNHIGQEGHDHGGPGQGIPDGQGRGFPDGRDFPGEAEDSAAPSA